MLALLLTGGRADQAAQRAHEAARRPEPGRAPRGRRSTTDLSQLPPRLHLRRRCRRCRRCHRRRRCWLRCQLEPSEISSRGSHSYPRRRAGCMGGRRCAELRASRDGVERRADGTRAGSIRSPPARSALLTGTKLMLRPPAERLLRELERTSWRAALGWAVGSARESRSMRTRGTCPYCTAASRGVSPPGSTAALYASSRAP